VVAAGVAFLLLRPALWELPGAAAVLAAGYLALAAAAAMGAGGDGAWPEARAARPGPLAWPVVLAVGLAGVVAVALAAGPAFALRADATAVGLDAVAAVAEEALFRGVLYGLLYGLLDRGARAALSRWRLPAALAVAGSAVLFALVHVPLYGAAAVPVDLGAGLLLAWQRWASGRWTVPAATHAVANLLAVILR